MTYGDVLNLAIEKSKGKADVFVDYAPHVNEIEIRIFIDGWTTKNSSDYILFSGYLHDRYKDEIATPKKCINFINNTLSDDTAEEHY